MAEEAFTKGAMANIFVPDATVIAWAQTNGAIEGDTLIDVLDKMQTGGFVVDGKTYDDGEPSSVDWTDSAILENAISQSPVKIGVAADQLQNVVPDPPLNGWFATGFTKDPNEDHCTALNGFGPVGWLAEGLTAAYGVTVPVPAGLYDTEFLYTLFTWKSVGFITPESMLAITAEAWLRTPATVVS